MDNIILEYNCSLCGAEGIYECNEEESKNLRDYWTYGPRQVGFMQDLFPNIPAWIRSGAIDTRANGFCICPNCNPFNC